MSNRPTIHEFQIRGETDDGENISETFAVVSDGPVIPRWKEVVYCYAIRKLWELRWTPGSVAWQVFTHDGIALPIGENY